MPHLLKRSVALLLVLVCATGLALAAPRNPSLLRPTAQLSAQALKLNLANALQTYKLAPAARERLTATYGQLPLDVQQTAAAMLDPKLADALGLPGVAFPRAKAQAVLERVDISLVRALLKVRLTEVAPASGGTPGDVAAAVGDNFTNDCIVQINGAAAPNTYYWANTLILFRIPDTATLGSTVNITVHKPSASETSAVRTLKIVAERGYRGVHGLSFPNFGDPNISWSVYRSCFGQSNVEFADGTHRPSAQTWYDSTYKTIGQNGNCYGMSQLSLRLREFTHYGNTSALSNVMHADWVGSNVTWGAWTLAWNTTSMEAVESLQGQQAVEPMATHIATQRANQDNKTAWDYARNMLNTQGRPVQNTLYGHAVVTFATEVDGTSHKFCFYDNNNPYTETDTDAPDPDHGVTNWNTGSFSYYTYWRTRCYDPHQLTGQPLLPAGVGTAPPRVRGRHAPSALRSRGWPGSSSRMRPVGAARKARACRACWRSSRRWAWAPFPPPSRASSCCNRPPAARSTSPSPMPAGRRGSSRASPAAACSSSASAAPPSAWASVSLLNSTPRPRCLTQAAPACSRSGSSRPSGRPRSVSCRATASRAWAPRRWRPRSAPTAAPSSCSAPPVRSRSVCGCSFAASILAAPTPGRISSSC